ncbi:MAG: FixH family protein [Phenylobacterium sp.]|nr:FixH family protein [Phenylobacterium sp.]MDO8899921.1 FixH family protein [Phenylobacterium sp.]MDP2212906.1 FixH family protein [Phenylobacterium sp.]
MESTDGFRIRGWHVLVAMILFFGIITAVNAVFITAALRTYPGEVSVTPYEDGLAFNAKLARQADQAKLGWRASAGAEAEAVAVRIIDDQGAAVRDLSLSGKLQRPATGAGALTPRFRETEPGLYVARLGGVTGVWDLTFQAQDAEGRQFEGERRLTWP